MSDAATIVWLRADLRVRDNPALHAAAARGLPVVPLFVWSPQDEGNWSPGAASRWWLDHSLRALDASLQERGSRLIVRRGPALDVLRDVIRETSAGAVFWNRRYEPAVIDRDQDVERALRTSGLQADSFNAALLQEPWENAKSDGTPYRVFTPFWNAMRRRGAIAAPAPAVPAIAAPRSWPAGERIEDLALRPEVDWTAGMRAVWTPGEQGAHQRLERFVREDLASYAAARDRPAAAATSRLSPHLHFGEISPRTLWHAVRDEAGDRGDARFDDAAEAWLRQLAWREFGHHLLLHFPHTTDAPLREDFTRFEWSEDPAALRAWQRGRTGYPIVDAGMRELWTTGWMHNRVRMIAASFLVKDLRIAWQAGAKWFWDTLVDADLAANTLGWQWVAGCGADAAPYFRVFNPLLQSRRFDPGGDYLRRWLPELTALGNRWIHEPSAAPAGVLAAAGVHIGTTYPAPVVAHDDARRLALDAYAAINGRR